MLNKQKISVIKEITLHNNQMLTRCFSSLVVKLFSPLFLLFSSFPLDAHAYLHNVHLCSSVHCCCLPCHQVLWILETPLDQEGSLFVIESWYKQYQDNDNSEFLDISNHLWMLGYQPPKHLPLWRSLHLHLFVHLQQMTPALDQQLRKHGTDRNHVYHKNTYTQYYTVKDWYALKSHYDGNTLQSVNSS